MDSSGDDTRYNARSPASLRAAPSLALHLLGPEGWGARDGRLVGDAADSPVVRTHGSRSQLSGGLALTYTWGGSK